jgi:hypothetical protein
MSRSSPPSLDELIELLETIWVGVDPNQEAEWRMALGMMDLEVAEVAMLTLRDASKLQPSVKLFEATYRGLKAKGKPRHPKADWFDEQRRVLRRAGSHRET